ncbi:MAG: hypothetical protein ACQEW5_28460 [Bacillota bacterium]
MNKILAISILGMGFTGAALIISVVLLFKSPIGNFELMFAAASAVACAVFTVSALVFRKRLDDKEQR